MMTFTTRAAGNSVAYNWLAVARHYLGGHRAIIVLAIVAVVVGAALNWSWLAAWPVHEPIGRPLLRERVIAATSGICAATNHAAGHEPNGPRYCAAWSCRLRS
jgi:hypothetical protein